MSKIFQAQQMKSGDKPAEQVKPVSTPVAIELFPRPQDSQTEDFSRLAQQALGIRNKKLGTVLFFASSTSGEGASFISFNLARTLAEVYGQKVAWVDANFLSPQKELLGQDWVSLSSMLKSPDLVEAVVPKGNPQLIPGGKDLVGARGLVAGDNYHRVMDGLAKQFDFVIVDLPPVLDSPETGLMALGGDGLLLVIEQKYLKWEIISHGIQVLRGKGVQVLGSVINRRAFTLPKFIYDRL